MFFLLSCYEHIIKSDMIYCSGRMFFIFPRLNEIEKETVEPLCFSLDTSRSVYLIRKPNKKDLGNMWLLVCRRVIARGNTEQQWIDGGSEVVAQEDRR